MFSTCANDVTSYDLNSTGIMSYEMHALYVKDVVFVHHMN